MRAERAQRELELLADDAGLVGDLESLLEDRHGGGGVTREPQRAPQVIQRVSMGEPVR